MLQQTNEKLQKSLSCDYVSAFLEKGIDEKRLKSGVKHIETYANRVKRHIGDILPEITKEEFLFVEQVKEVTEVVLDRWQPYIAKYP